jgi:hypothetical protein
LHIAHCTLHMPVSFVSSCGLALSMAIPGKADSADCNGHGSGDRRPDQELVWDRHSVVATLPVTGHVGFWEDIP